MTNEQASDPLRELRKITVMICQDCGVETETRYASFYENVGAILVRFPKSVEGRLCKSCIHKRFWGMTTTTFFLGWWGGVSMLVTPFILLNNIGHYLRCLFMPAVPRGASRPLLTPTAVEKIQPHAPELFSRLNEGEDLAAVAALVAERAGVTPGQVALFVQAAVQAQTQADTRPAEQPAATGSPRDGQ
jgi:hypothetical protein